ncbi:MAG: hypothetical protein QOH72_2938 [Solirubrobacteraceae bacterium]|nr:hypothetical protein [Solirubrobacteraceae bacterium]
MSLPFPKIPRDTVAKLYIGAVIAVGFAILVPLIVLRGPDVVRHLDHTIVILGIAVVIGEVLPVKLGDNEGELVPSTTFMFALVLFGGVGAAMLTQVVASTLADRIHKKRPVSSAFNLGQYMLAIGSSGLVYRLLAGGPSNGTFTAEEVGAAVVAGGVFFVVNTGLVSTVIALTSGSRIRDEFSSELMRQTVTEGVLLGLAPLAVIAVNSSIALVPLLGLPLLAVQRAGTHALVSRRLALHDALTGLPNRILFADRTRRAIGTAEHADGPVVVMLIDLDRFKDINDTLGHHYGDEVLRQMAGRLTGLLDPRDTPSPASAATSSASSCAPRRRRPRAWPSPTRSAAPSPSRSSPRA